MRASKKLGPATGRAPRVAAYETSAKEQMKKASTAVRGPKRRIRYAVIGLGHIAQNAVLPAFAHVTRNSQLAALVSDDPVKLRELGERYQVAALYDYQGLRQCLAEESIDAVYVATPNTEHGRFVRAAASAGVHVLCEKPLAVTETECLEMIRTCEAAKVLLMTAYRLHFEAANLKVLETLKSGAIGDPRVFTSVFSYQVVDPDNIRLRGDLGGGPLHDIGIYCVNAARSVFQAEPTHVHAWRANFGDPRFRTVDETVMAQLRFPEERLATFTCSFGLTTASWYQVIGTKGDIRMDPAYDYSEPLEMAVTIEEHTRTRQFAKKDQFAAELQYFSKCVMEGREPEPSGWEGLADVRVMRAIEQSMERGTALELPPTPHTRHPEPGQRINKPPARKRPKLVHARAAST